MQQEERDTAPAHIELSSTWLELLGRYAEDTTLCMGEVVIPILESDPWSKLLQTKGAEVVDLQQVHLQVDDQDMEQMLRLMQDSSAQHPEL